MYIQVVSLLAVPFVATVCDATSDTAERDAFYKQVSTVSRSLDPRDYIVDPEVNQSNKYNNAHMDMIGEMTIFYYAEAVADKHVTLSLTSSEQQDYEVKFEIYEEEAYLVEYNGSAKNVNYARVDDNMMRFYVCFLGKLCPMNALNVKYPLTHFKIESNDIHSLMRIFIKGFFFGMEEHVKNPPLDYKKRSYKRTNILFEHNVPQEQICYFRVYEGKGIVIVYNTYVMSGPDEMEYYSLGFKELQVRFLSLRFALLMIITNDITKERFVYKLLTADKLPTGTFSFYVYGAGFVHECRTVYNTFFTN